MTFMEEHVVRYEKFCLMTWLGSGREGSPVERRIRFPSWFTTTASSRLSIIEDSPTSCCEGKLSAMWAGWFFASSPPPPFPRSSPQASWGSWEPGKISKRNCVTQHKFHIFDKLSSTIFCCLSVCEASVTPDQISTFSNIYRHTSPMLTQYNI